MKLYLRMELSYDFDELEKASGEFLHIISDNTLVAFYGNLGAGKTTFIKAVCERLGVQQNISSPTFSIINEYTTLENKTIYHMDLYRLKDEEEAINAGVEECIDSHDLCFVEWPDRAERFFENDCVKVYFEIISPTERKIKIVLPF